MTGRFHILHNPHDADSRAFVEAHAKDPDVAEVLLWFPVETGELAETGRMVPTGDYDDAGDPVLVAELVPVFAGEGDRERWVKLGGTEQVSAFPAIIYDQPAYTEQVLLQPDPKVPAAMEDVEREAQQLVVNWDTAVAEVLRAEDADPIELHLFHAQQLAANAEAMAAITEAEAGGDTKAAEQCVAAAEYLGADRAEQARERLDQLTNG